MIPNKETADIRRRSTGQRETVLEAVKRGCHPSARDIFMDVSRESGMSFGTVYRNLQILAETGEIACVDADPGAMRYDRRLDRHHHLYCRACGGVFDVPLPYREDIDREAAAASGFVVESHTTSFRGLCPQCAGKTAPPPADGA